MESETGKSSLCSSSPGPGNPEIRDGAERDQGTSTPPRWGTGVHSARERMLVEHRQGPVDKGGSSRKLKVEALGELDEEVGGVFGQGKG